MDLQQEKYADMLGIPETTLRNYETNAREPGHVFLTQMSNFFSVSTDYLLGLPEEKEKFSTHQLKTSEYDHIKKYRSLDSFDKETVDFILEREAIRSKEAKEQHEYIFELESFLMRIAREMQKHA